MRTLQHLLALLALALCPALLTACETCTTSGERRCGDGEILTCVDSPDATSSFEIATPCGDANPTCVEDATAYPPVAACALEEGQNGCNTCADARYLRSCSMVGTRPVVLATDCRAQYPDPNYPGICDPAYSGCRQCNPAAENCDGTCSPGETRCMNGLLATCLDDGKSWTTFTCTNPNYQCFEDTSVTPRQAACVNQIGSTSCFGCNGTDLYTCARVGNTDVVVLQSCIDAAAGTSSCDSNSNSCR